MTWIDWANQALVEDGAVVSLRFLKHNTGNANCRGREIERPNMCTFLQNGSRKVKKKTQEAAFAPKKGAGRKKRS